MERIASFQINHEKMSKGIFVSRIDELGVEKITTFDIRIKLPNREPVLNISEMHTMEHLGATFLRNHKEWSDKLIYWGPMGCRTGFYVIFKGELKSTDIIDIIKETFTFMSIFEGEIPGATAIECGNYLDQNLPMAKFESKKYLEEILNRLNEDNLNYPAY